MFSFLRGLRRNRLAARPFPEAWEPIVAKGFPALAAVERFRLHLKVFALDKDWAGAAGLVVLGVIVAQGRRDP